MIDFRSIAKELRKALQDTPPATLVDGKLVENPASRAVRDHLVTCERAMVLEALAYLYDHLTYHEQWVKAATILAHGVPHCVRGDPKVKALIEHAARIASRIETPADELAAYLKDPAPHVLPEWMAQPGYMQVRAQYWLQVVKLREAQRAMEWATGAGLNVIQAAQIYQDVSWFGVDAKVANVLQAKALALKLGVAYAFSTEYTTGWYKSMDVVAVLDTLEHSAHPGALLDKAEAYLRDGGAMVVSVPNGPWSLHTPNDAIVEQTPGNHINVQHASDLLPFLYLRGATVLDCRVLEGPYARSEGNSTLCLTYKPKV